MARHSPSFSLKATINKHLIDFEPKTVEEIQKVVEEEEERPSSTKRIELILEGNPDLYEKTKDGKWTITLQNFPEHNAALEILRESKKMLTPFQLKRAVAKKQPKNQRSQIVLNLEDDDRFLFYNEKKWTLKEKVNVADEAYEALKTAGESMTERKLLKAIASQKDIDESLILFDPTTYGDKRFYRDRNDRWNLTERRKAAEAAEAEEAKPKRQRIEAIAISPEKMATIQTLFNEEMPELTVDYMVQQAFEVRPDDDDYEVLEYSLMRSLKRNTSFEPISLDDKEWTLERLLPIDIKEPPSLKPGKRIRVTTWLEYGDDDYMKDEGLAEDEMVFEALVEERKGTIDSEMKIERILSAFEYENGILFLRPCDRPFFPEKPNYLRCSFFDELNKKHDVYLNNKHGFLYGLKEWYDSIENPFAARFSIYGNPNSSDYRLLYKRETETFNQMTPERISMLQELWYRVNDEGMKTTEIILEVMRQHPHGTDPKRLLWEANAIRYIPARTVYGILSYFQCFARKKGTDRWYLDEKLINKGADPDYADHLEKRTKPRMGEWLMSPKGAERFENIMNTFKDWEGREAYFAFHERTQKAAQEKAQQIVSARPASEPDLDEFYEAVSDLFNTLNWHKNDPDSGCWNLVLINTDRWGIFESVENANYFIDLIQAFLDKEDVVELDDALATFISYEVRGLQSATLSPVLFCLQPKLYAVINKSIATGFERLTGLPLSTELADYLAVNEMMREFLERYELFDFSDVDGFFSHCISGHLELETYDDLMKIPPIKKAMDLLIGEFEDEEEPEGEEDDSEIGVIDESLKNEITNIANKLFATEDLHSDLARQLTEIRIQAIWQGGDIADNFDNFLQANFAIPQKNRYLTPRQAIDFVVKLMKPQLSEKVIDLCMGTGGFLIMVGDDFWRQFEESKIDKLQNAVKVVPARGNPMVYAQEQVLGDTPVDSEEGREKLFRYILTQNLYGIDIDPEAAAATRLNLKLRRLMGVNLSQADALSKKSTIDGFGSNIFDLAIGHPPVEVGMGKKFLKEFLRVLKPGGRLAIILEADEYDEKRVKAWKKDMLKGTTIDALISLPAWDEERFGPQSNLLIVHNSSTDHAMFKETLDSFDDMDDLVTQYQESRSLA